ncbi:type II toxin-antitoxin system Phd/YefM family antitoxin [Desulfosporosinus sp. BICA1-9]|uniref:type II toxin-antitoxin system Phd/YefM family antitoxin n=1 Tax=Desulfosporosinus sp. BICA1-9 TaxID=1531958 RepID=UPI00054C79D8|nr:type II toxin-antitoxin system Phd/YefM family antitoxin [Desulfosporosinus sp. BICA1-9]KJS49266.1 MAG: antitoxin PHD [Peptococcaceae bacterium BRH_c23]KJS89175.1 MAG: antitoxin PHD [Desulfosporosinus sp. BICA1-9]HBW37090.1 type II toxin-antitoxin system Phd/YefM family antitoxin [Desulfosporosinus sp.]
MPLIRPSSDLRNKYNEISDFCHKYSEPVYITKNGQGDLAVMSIETFERIVGKFELCKLLNEGIDDIRNNRVLSAEDVFKQVESAIRE